MTFEDKEVEDHQKGPDHIIPTTARSTWHRNGAVAVDFPLNGHTPISVPTSLRLQAEKNPNKVAFGIKRDGKWLQWTFGKYYQQVRIVAKAFIKLGLKRFHAVSILGANGPEWIIGEMAAIFAGGLVNGIYPTNSPSACSYLLRDSGTNICIVDSEIQLKKILEVRDEVQELYACIQYLGTTSHPGIISWEDLLELGKSLPDDILEKRLRGISINQPCVIVYTSGTTAATPKGCLFNHDQLLYSAKRTGEFYNCTIDDVNISHLPMSHVASQIGDIFVSLVFGLAVYIAAPDALKGSLAETLKEVRPTVMVTVPRVWEKVMEKLCKAEREMPWIQRRLFAWARQVVLQRNTSDTLQESAFYWAAKKLFFNKIRAALGLDKSRFLGVGSTLVDLKLINFLFSIDLPIYEGYGLTETCGMASANHPEKFRIGSVGMSLERSELKITEEGEICMTGRCILMGYLNNEEATMEAIDEQQWLHSGDLGRLDHDGFLYITGRKKELLITSGGENIAPLPIEDKIRQELCVISNAMVVADKRKYLSVLLTLKTELDEDGVPTDILTEQVQDWFEERGCKVTTVRDAIENLTDAVCEDIQKAIDQVNRNAISNAARVQKWVFLPRDFSIQTGEIGPTMKLRRPIIVDKYISLIDSLYDG